MSCLGPDADLLSSLVAQEDALLLGVLRRMDTRYATGIACRRIDRESSIDVAAGLVELDSLPSVLGSLTDTCNIHAALGLRMDAPLNLILTEPQGQVEIESLVLLARLRLLEAGLV